MNSNANHSIIFSITGQYVPRKHDLGIYAASKHAVTALSEAISHELAREKGKIRVTVHTK